MTTRPALLVFAKTPEPGTVKTRLCPPLTPAQAATLYEAFLADALAAYAAFGANAGVAVRLYLRGDAARVAPLVPAGVSVHAQRGDDLGQALLAAFLDTFVTGHDAAVVIGTDHPTLPTDYIALAFEALAEPRTCVLGPSDDGGYYLLGTGEVTSSLFDLSFSHSGVFDATLDRALGAGLQPVVLPPHYDVDDADSLARLVREWRGGSAVGPRTASALDDLASDPSLMSLFVP
jgi:rSAM/selenodomain-associated transferase 1